MLIVFKILKKNIPSWYFILFEPIISGQSNNLGAQPGYRRNRMDVVTSGRDHSTTSEEGDIVLILQGFGTVDRVK